MIASIARMLANEGVRLRRWSHELSSSVAMMIASASFDREDDREPEVRLRRESLGRTSSVATMVARTSIAMIIATSQFGRDDDRTNE
jgi:hypothetical protein